MAVLATCLICIFIVIVVIICMRRTKNQSKSTSPDINLYGNNVGVNVMGFNRKYQPPTPGQLWVHTTRMPQNIAEQECESIY